MNICKDCRHCRVSGFERDPDLWKCVAPGNGTNPQSGRPRRVYAEDKNPRGQCKDFEPIERRAQPEQPPQTRYRSPLWIRILRWFIQEEA